MNLKNIFHTAIIISCMSDFVQTAAGSDVSVSHQNVLSLLLMPDGTFRRLIPMVDAKTQHNSFGITHQTTMQSCYINGLLCMVQTLPDNQFIPSQSQTNQNLCVRPSYPIKSIPYHSGKKPNPPAYQVPLNTHCQQKNHTHPAPQVMSQRGRCLNYKTCKICLEQNASSSNS